MFHEQPFQCLLRNARCRPGRTIAEGHFARIGKAGLQGRTRLPVDDRDLVASFGKIVSTGDPDDARAQNGNFHVVPQYSYAEI